METFELLGVALGLATLAGLNLYLTVFASGLAVHFHWVTLPQQLESLQVLGDPWVVAISGVLYFLQFFADKIPWIDSLNDGFHTLIRPIGGALLAVLAMGDANPTVKIVAALLAGGAALTSHLAKSGIRLTANASPEPLSNVGLSVGEDVVVLGGLSLLIFYPIVAIIVALVFIAAIWLLLPRVVRSIQAKLWLIWKKLNAPALDKVTLPPQLPASYERLLHQSHAALQPVHRAIPGLSGGGPHLPKNYRGWLVQLHDENNRSLFFIAKRWRGPLIIEVALLGTVPIRESKFMCERLELHHADGVSHVFYFERSLAPLVDELADSLKQDPSPEEENIETVPSVIGEEAEESVVEESTEQESSESKTTS